MTYRKILVPLRGSAADAQVLKAAFDVASAFGSHVAGLYVKPDPSTLLRHLGPAVSARVRQEIADAASDDARHTAEAAHAALIHAAKVADAPVQPLAKAVAGIGASFHLHAGLTENVIVEEARLCDLCVFASPAEAKDFAQLTALETVLLEGRRPLVVVPHRSATFVGAKIAIGWDDGAAAANAVSAAVPLLKRADAVEIINVASGPMKTAQMDRLRDYLRLQGKNAVEHCINPGAKDTATALLEAAQMSGAGLLVIGGYGHSRLRELVLGGVTRYVLANAVMPVFMAH